MKGRSRSGFTAGDFNPLFLGDPDDHCEVCGTRLRDNRLLELNVCPFGPHDTPRSAA